MAQEHPTDEVLAESDLRERIARLEARLAQLERQPVRYTGVSIICFSGEWDRLFAAFTIANGALAAGFEVHMFFTFWGAAALRDPRRRRPKRLLAERLIAHLMPDEAKDAPLSRWHFWGLGKRMLRWLMRKKGVEDLDTLIANARELGAHFHMCETSFGLFGLDERELVDCERLDCCGVATFLAEAGRGHMVFFI